MVPRGNIQTQMFVGLSENELFSFPRDLDTQSPIKLMRIGHTQPLSGFEKLVLKSILVNNNGLVLGSFWLISARTA